MSTDKLKNLFHEKLYNHESKLQPSDWEIISRRIKQKRHRKIIPLFYIYSTTGIAVAMLIIMFLIKPDSENINKNITGKSNTQLQPEKNAKTTTTDSQNKNIEKNNSAENTNQNQVTNIIANTDKPDETTDIQYNEYNNKINQNQETTDDTDINKPADKIEKIDYSKFAVKYIIEEIYPENFITQKMETKYSAEKQESESTDNKESQQENNNDEWWNQPETETAKEKHKTKWMFALASGNNIGASSTISDFTKTELKYNAIQSEYNTLPPIMSAMPESLKDEPKINLKHKYPLNLGLRIKKSLSKRIIIKTGLSYSYFLSEFDNAERKIQQQIHYVGIPIGAEFLLWGKNNFNIYMSGEFAFEKGILHIFRQSIQGISDIESYNPTNGSVRGLQFSTNAGLGISYNFIKNVGIYVEPNAVYYIKDDRQPQSFRTEKSFNFGLNIGFKYDF
ncbi:MAG: hypothetical protein LBE11_07185 [Prevotellaceae bacterium]|jgi:hypothetical protein|nr:hypothetical protein [Prevotellaceae bacterium]